MSTTSHSTPPERELPPAVRNGLIRADQIPPPREGLEDPTTRDARYAHLAQWLEERDAQPVPDDEPDWDVDELFPTDRIR